MNWTWYLAGFSFQKAGRDTRNGNTGLTAYDHTQTEMNKFLFQFLYNVSFVEGQRQLEMRLQWRRLNVDESFFILSRMHCIKQNLKKRSNENVGIID